MLSLVLMIRFRLPILSIALAAAVAPVGTATPTASELAQALQRRYDSVQDFSADFVQIYQGGVLRKQITERGHVVIKKPGKMRWEYAAPDQKLFVSDGVKMYSYIPADKQVIVTTIPRDDQSTTPTLFLAGKGNLTRDFTPSLVDLPPGLPPNSQALKLVPKTPQREYDWVVLAVNPGRLEIRGLSSVDAQGGTSTLSFANLKENTGASDNQFAFKIPRGVDVVTDAPR
jgi:outer membrane lipoprotein carrier protein